MFFGFDFLVLFLYSKEAGNLYDLNFWNNYYKLKYLIGPIAYFMLKVLDMYTPFHFSLLYLDIGNIAGFHFSLKEGGWIDGR